MTRLLIDRPPDQTRALVVKAFQETEGITEIAGEGRQIIAKTDISLPRVLWSYGETVYVDLSDPNKEGQTPIEVWAEKALWTNVGANPEKFKRRFLKEVDRLRDIPPEELEVTPPRSGTSSAASTSARPPTSSRSAGPSISLGQLGYPFAVVLGGMVGLFAGLAITLTSTTPTGVPVLPYVGALVGGISAPLGYHLV